SLLSPRSALFPYTTLFRSVIVLFPLSIVIGLTSGGGYAERGSGYANAGVNVGGNVFWLLLAVAVGYYVVCEAATGATLGKRMVRSEEHTSELQSRVDLVCR